MNETSGDTASMPPISLLGAFIVGILFGGLLLYAFIGVDERGQACFTDAWNAVSLVAGLLGGVPLGLYFEYRAKKQRLASSDVTAKDQTAAMHELIALLKRQIEKGFLNYLRHIFAP